MLIYMIKCDYTGCKFMVNLEFWFAILSPLPAEKG